VTPAGSLLPAACLLLAACCPSDLRAGRTVEVTVTDAESEKAATRAVVAGMEAAWNRGDFRGYMAAFKKPDVVFVSKGRFQQGWQGTLDHYIRDYGGSPERRGKLHFYNMKVDLLASDAAMLIGQYRLQRGSRITEGVNTRLFRKVHGRWLITVNHVSAYDAAPTAPAAK
jgi:uncharacterized protein (TIGR02246 family)